MHNSGLVLALFTIEENLIAIYNSPVRFEVISFGLEGTFTFIKHTLLFFLVVAEAFDDRRVKGVGKFLFNFVGILFSQVGEGGVAFGTIAGCDVQLTELTLFVLETRRIFGWG